MQEINQNNRTNQEIYDCIISKIKAMYQGKITELEAQEAAKNLIGLCQEIFDYKIEQQIKIKKTRVRGEKNHS